MARNVKVWFMYFFMPMQTIWYYTQIELLQTRFAEVHDTLLSCSHENDLKVIDVQSILAVVAMVPHQPFHFVVEKLGLDVASSKLGLGDVTPQNRLRYSGRYRRSPSQVHHLLLSALVSLLSLLYFFLSFPSLSFLYISPILISYGNQTPPRNKHAGAL